jgi:hypothetical protein
LAVSYHNGRTQNRDKWRGSFETGNELVVLHKMVEFSGVASERG